MSDALRSTHPHRRVLASAGSGKTYQLAGRFLQLVADGASADSILATTFTRAAAGEILARILRDAADAVRGEAARVKLARRIAEQAGDGRAADSFDGAAANALLDALVEGLPRLQVRTLDSFFGSVAAAFSEEFGLGERIEVSDEAAIEATRRRSIDQLVEEFRDEPDLLVSSLLVLTRGAGGTSVASSLDRQVAALHPIWLQSAGGIAAWTWDATAATRATPESFARLATALTDLAGQLDKKSQVTACSKVAELAARLANDLDDSDAAFDLAGSTILQKAVAGETYSRATIDDRAAALLVELADLIPGVVWGEVVRRTERTAQFLGAYDSILKRRKQIEGVVGFEDIVQSVASLGDDPSFAEENSERGDGRLADLFYRLDGRVEHLLLDEFQDTSLAQWRALAPLAREVVSHADGSRTFFCVGDLKQSIYGWRGGEPRILASLERLFIRDSIVPLRDAPLVRSYRSAPPVISFVNKVFEALPARGDVAGIDFATIWDEHETAVAPRPDAGVVLLGLPTLEDGSAPKRSSEEKQQAAARAAADVVRRLRESGDRGSIAVLARRNRTVGRVQSLLAADGIPTRGQRGGRFEDCGATTVLIDLLEFAEHPENAIAAFDVQQSPLGAELERAFSIETTRDGRGPESGAERARAKADQTRWSDERRRSIARALRTRFESDGIARTIEAIVESIEATLDERSLARVRSLVEATDRIERSGVTRAREIARSLAAMRLDDPSIAEVAVMSIHQSKGLEFDTVVVVDLGDGRSGSFPVATARDPETLAVVRALRWVRETARPILAEIAPDVERLHRETEDASWFEGCCAVYVALTRARTRLFAITTSDKIGDPVDVTKGFNAEQLLASVGSSDLAWTIGGCPVLCMTGGGADLVQRIGDGEPDDEAFGDELPVTPTSDRSDDPEREATLPVAIAGGALLPEQSRPLRVRPTLPSAATAAPPSHHAAGVRRVRFSRDEITANDAGTLLHALFETIEFLDDRSIPTDATLRAAARDAVPAASSRTIDELVDRFRTACASPAIACLLGRDPFEGARADSSSLRTIEVRREWRFVRRGDDGTPQQGIVDRVVIERSSGAGTATRAIVIDWKSDGVDHLDDAALAEHARERYGAQLAQYADAVATRFGVPISQVERAVGFVRDGRVVRLG